MLFSLQTLADNYFSEKLTTVTFEKLKYMRCTNFEDIKTFISIGHNIPDVYTPNVYP